MLVSAVPKTSFVINHQRITGDCISTDASDIGERMTLTDTNSAGTQ